MSRRRPPKRARLSPSETSHIFSASLQPSERTQLHPCSYEITLNHDTELYRSLHLAPDATSSEREQWATRLVTWTGTDGRSVVSDRFDAVHLLTELPAKSSSGVGQDGDEGWSDLDSDAEDVFYMTDSEAAAFTHDRARARLEAQHTARVAAMPSPSPPASEYEEEEDALAKSQFELMRKTARVLAESGHPAQLELKILANHAADARFDFLRPTPQQSGIANVWTHLKAQPALPYDAARKLAKPIQAALVAYDSDSDSNSDSNSDSEPPQAEPPSDRPSESRPQSEPDADVEKTRKQAERLARAREWLKSRS
ncbi:uncharacterized protein PAN0_004d2440 [Moesziomyces antarcticus]|uniref:Uncharacterized protein n=2 Tax=Pseudozyma antarctica TaxID=84753 RepID=A0A5C3FJJ0_PSEA2|nr:uncharacterized protein PAN0_004d2440 [Moesziomyces antarcticus]GAK64230.1 conserved hypothetical protein [Moesziomyces antarcticus]SPO44543.1 uncharacterized protein PSANT_02228 [Moesziomyces antarcticus]